MKFPRFEILNHEAHYALPTSSLSLSQTCSKSSRATLTVMVCFFCSSVLFSVAGYAGYFPVHPSTRLHAWRLTQKQEEEANKNNEEDLTASEATWEKYDPLERVKFMYLVVYSEALELIYCHLLASFQKDLWIRLQPRLSL